MSADTQAMLGASIDRKHNNGIISPSMAGVPSLATDQVAAGLPLNTIRTAGAVRVGDGRGSIRPPGVEIAIVGALLVGSDLSLLEAGSGDDAGDSGTGGHKRGEADHDDGYQR